MLITNKPRLMANDHLTSPHVELRAVERSLAIRSYVTLSLWDHMTSRQTSCPQPYPRRFEPIPNSTLQEEPTDCNVDPLSRLCHSENRSPPLFKVTQKYIGATNIITTPQSCLKTHRVNMFPRAKQDHNCPGTNIGDVML